MKRITLLFFTIITLFNACKSDEPVIADFEFTEGANGEITFTNKSTGADSYEWDFGGGKISYAQNPKYTFEDNKDYTVSLTAKGKGGQNQKSKSLKVTTFDRTTFITNKQYSVLTGYNSFITPTPEQAAQRFKVDVIRCGQNSAQVQVYDKQGTTYQLNIDSGCQVIQTSSNGEYFIPNSSLALPNQTDKAFVWKLSDDKKSGSFNINAYWNNSTVTPRFFWIITTNFK